MQPQPFAIPQPLTESITDSMADLFQSSLDRDLKAITNALATYLTWSLQNSVTKHNNAAANHPQDSVAQQLLTLDQPAVEFNQDQCHEVGHDASQVNKVEDDISRQEITDRKHSTFAKTDPD
jgi:hypothetical protein